MKHEGRLSNETIRRLRPNPNPPANRYTVSDPSSPEPASDAERKTKDGTSQEASFLVDIPFQSVDYMPPEIRAIWLGNDESLTVPGVGEIAHKSRKRVSKNTPDSADENTDENTTVMPSVQPDEDEDEEDDDEEDDLLPSNADDQPQGPPEYDSNLVYTIGHSELSEHRETYMRYYLANQLTGFKNSQVLEMLLHFAFPQRNTAMLADSLMERFGSLHGVLGAGVDLLETVRGMNRQSAVLLDMVMQVAQRAVEEQNSSNDLLNTDQKVGEYLLRKFYGLTNETIFLLCLDNNCRLVSCTQLAQGSSSAVRVSVRQICETAIISNSPNVILAHNHPGGRAYPSSEDIRTTSRLQGLLKMMDIDLVDHFIVAGNEWKSMAQMGELAVTRVTHC